MIRSFLMALLGFAFFTACESSDDDTATTSTDDTSSVSDTGDDTTTGNDTANVPGTYTDLDAPAVNALLEEDYYAVVIDVSPYYDAGHIPGSLNFYVGGTELDNALPSIDKAFTYIIYCHSDAASIPAAEKFVKAGFPNVYRLAGNYAAWTSAGFPVQQTADGYMDVTPTAANVLIDGKSNVTTIDVSPVYDEGHLPGAVSYPLGDGSLEAVIPTLKSEQIYLVYCHGVEPSVTASEMIFAAGFAPVYRLAGNYSAWVAYGFSVETTANY